MRLGLTRYAGVRRPSLRFFNLVGPVGADHSPFAASPGRTTQLRDDASRHVALFIS